MRTFLLILIGFICLQAEGQTPMHKLVRKQASSTTCDAPTSVVISAITQTTCTVSWTAASPVPSLGYDVQVRRVSDEALISGYNTTSGTTQPVGGLTAGVQYRIDVRSWCSTGPDVYSSFSSSANFTTSTGIEARINLSLAAYTVSTYNNLNTSPRTGVRSIANLNNISGSATGWGITTIATANWKDSTFNVSATDGIAGMTAASFFAGSTSNVWSHGYYQLGGTSPAIYTAGTPQFRFSGLDPTRVYTILIGGADGTYTFDASQMEYRVDGLTLSSAQTVNGNVTSITTGATFDVQPKVGGTIDVYANTVTGSNKLNMIQAIILKEK